MNWSVSAAFTEADTCFLLKRSEYALSAPCELGFALSSISWRCLPSAHKIRNYAISSVNGVQSAWAGQWLGSGQRGKRRSPRVGSGEKPAAHAFPRSPRPRAPWVRSLPSSEPTVFLGFHFRGCAGKRSSVLGVLRVSMRIHASSACGYGKLHGDGSMLMCMCGVGNKSVRPLSLCCTAGDLGSALHSNASVQQVCIHVCLRAKRGRAQQGAH